MKKDKFIEIFIIVAIVALCVTALIALGYFIYWVITNPNIPDWLKYGLMFGRK